MIRSSAQRSFFNKRKVSFFDRRIVNFITFAVFFQVFLSKTVTFRLFRRFTYQKHAPFALTLTNLLNLGFQVQRNGKPG